MTVRPFQPRDPAKNPDSLSQRGTFIGQEIRVAPEVIEEGYLHPERGEQLVYCLSAEADLRSGLVCFGAIPMTGPAYDLYRIAVGERVVRRGAAEASCPLHGRGGRGLHLIQVQI